MGKLIEVSSSDYYQNGGWVMVTTHRLILLTEDQSGGVYWPLKTTSFVQLDSNFFKGSTFVFQSTVENASKRSLRIKDSKEAEVLHSLFLTNQEFHEYDTVHINNRNNILAIFTEECTTVNRFADALSICSHNATALFIWLVSVVYVCNHYHN